jgi:hypothetical protein
MKRLALAGLCAALIAGPVFAQGEPSQPPKPPELLARLKAAIPSDDGPDIGTEEAEAIRRMLSPLNPGREREVEALAAARFACENGQMNNVRIRDLIVESVDKRLTQAEVERLVAFYEGPEYQALAALDGLPDDDPKKVAAAEKVAQDPVFAKLPGVIRDGMLEYMSKPGVMEAAMACETDYLKALEKSGLVRP